MQNKPHSPLTIKPAVLNTRQVTATQTKQPHPKVQHKQPTAAELSASKLTQELDKAKAQIKDAEARAASAEARAAAMEKAMDSIPPKPLFSPLTPPPSPPPPPPPPPSITNHASAAPPTQKPSADPSISDLLESIRAGTKLTHVSENIKQKMEPQANWMKAALDKKFAGVNPDIIASAGKILVSAGAREGSTRTNTPTVTNNTTKENAL